MARKPKPPTPRQPVNRPAAGGASWLHQCPQWPLYEALLADDWRDYTKLASMLVARQSPRSGKVAVASFLVDRACLGVKTAFVRICKSPEDYERRVRRPLLKEQPMQPAELNLIAKIVAESVAYAEGLGLAPDPEYQQARRLLAEAQPEACTEDVPLGGDEGKPHYFVGPTDNMERVVATLTRTLGSDGFYITLPAPERPDDDTI
jgi:hypothetical protein